MAKLTVNDLNVSGKRVFVRVDYNVPMEEINGQMVINDETRIRETRATLELLIKKGAKIILASHLGRQRAARTVDVAAAIRREIGGSIDGRRFRG
jgi:phosphoglycerate kinase